MRWMQVTNIWRIFVTDYSAFASLKLKIITRSPMNINHYLISALFALLLLAGCATDPATATLDRAETLMDLHPDSALALLDTLPSPASAKENARYALLYSQALDKNYIDVADDSLITIAVDYYRHKESIREIMSMYYRATVHFNAGYNDKAVLDATYAYELASRLNDSYWIAKSADRVADIFYKTYNNEECIKFRKIAISAYIDANEPEHIDWSRLCLAVDYSADNKYDEAIRIIDSIMPNICHTSKDSVFKSHCIQSLFHFYVDTQKFKLAEDYFYRLLNFKCATISAADYGDMGYVEVNLGKMEDAKKYIDSAYILASNNNAQEILAADIASWEYLKRTGDKNDVVKFTEKLIDTQNKIARETIRQAALRAQRDYYNSNFILAKKNESRLWHYLIASLIFTALITIVITMFTRLKIKLKNKDIELKAIEIAHLSSKIQERDKLYVSNETTENEKIHRVIDRLLTEWFRPINSIFDDFYENGDSSVAKSTMFSRVKDELNKITSKKSMRDIEKLVDDSLGGVLSRFHNQVPDIDDNDITFIALNIARLSPRAICLFLDIKVKTVYSKRKRLKDKIAASNATDKEQLIRYLK